jgi:hypothetical protein
LHLKFSKKWGKGYWLFPLAFLVNSSCVSAQWQNLFGALAIFRTIPVPPRAQIQAATRQIELDYRFDDIYRKKVFDQQALLLNQQGITTLITYPFRTKSHYQLVTLKTHFSESCANNHNDQTAISGSLQGDGFDYSLAWTAAGSKNMIGFLARYVQLKTNTNLNIESYPASEDKNLNKYFLNWLPLTFGNPVTNQSQFKFSEISGWGSIPINRKNQLQLSGSRVKSDNRLAFQYVNSTNKLILNGTRQLDIPVNFDLSQISLALLRPNRSISSVEISYLLTDLDFNSDNNPPVDTTGLVSDLESLGQGKLQNQGLSLSIGHSKKKHHFSVGLSSSTIKGDLIVQTPVLGYIEFLGIPIIPIHHKANGQIERGRAFSQKLHYSTATNFRNMEIFLTADYLHSRYQLQIVGQAELEFGLIAEPIDYPIRIDANIFDIQIKVCRKIKDFNFYYSLHQLLPIIRRLDESPIHLIEQIPGKKITERGGASHQLGIIYEF